MTHAINRTISVVDMPRITLHLAIGSPVMPRRQASAASVRDAPRGARFEARGVLFCAAAAVAAIVAICAPRLACAGQPGAAGQSPLDRELFGPDVRPSAPLGSGGTERPDRSWAERLRQELGAAAESEDDPLWLRAMIRMEEAAESLQSGRTADAAEKQRAAAALWDELLAAARRSGSSGAATVGGEAASNANAQTSDAPSQGGNRAGSRPVERPAAGGADPSQPGGSAESGEPLVQVLARLWGELPARLRQQVQQPLVEDFVPNYEAVTEQYFRRLAEQE